MKGRIEFANFTVRFGDKVLIDYLNEVIIPAFKGSIETKPKYATKYFFHKVEIIEADWFGQKVHCIVGYVIKDMEIKQEQYYDGSSIVKSDTVFRKSPTSIFCLIIENHKLIYYPETAGAPGIRAFEGTVKKFIAYQHRKMVDREYKNEKEGNKKLLKRDFQKEYPKPDVNIIPIGNQQSLSDFIGIYDVIKSIEIKIIKPNNEVDPNEFFQEFHEQQERLNSTDAAIRHSNPEGLNKIIVTSELQAAVASGNARILTSGIGSDGIEISGNNQDTRLKIAVKNVPKTIREAGLRFVRFLEELTTNKTVSIRPEIEANVSKSVTEKLNEKSS